MDQALRKDAFLDFIEVFSDSCLAADVGPRFTCTEIDALASAFDALGHPDIAARWIAGHADEDEEGDDHHTPG
ncbi:hypothetical protein ACU686_26645 [Yinghuangia aomiensis]